MEANIYLAIAGKGFRRQDGTGGYLIEMSDGEKTVKRAFRFEYKNETANRAFLLVLTRSGEFLKGVKNLRKIHVYTPNEYMVVNFYQVKRWKETGWRTARGQPVKNADLWQQVDEATRGIPADITLDSGKNIRELEEMLRKVEE